MLVGSYGSGTKSSRFGDVARYGPSGKPDASFVGDRRTRTSRPGHVAIAAGKGHRITVSDMIMLGKRGMLIAGIYDGKFMVAKLNHRGGYDRGFGRRGMVTVDVEPGRNNPFKASCAGCTALSGIARTEGGKILVAGSSPYSQSTGDNQRLILMRLTPGGRLDRSFGTRGVKVIYRGHGARANDVAVQRDGRIVVVGVRGGACAVTRLTPDGRLDPAFFGNGVYSVSGLGCPNGVLIDHSGRLVVAGGDYQPEFHPATSYLLRILPNAG